jgi:hypothetical protein
LRDTRLSDLTTYLTGTPMTAFTGRMDWGEADNLLRWLRGQ